MHLFRIYLMNVCASLLKCPKCIIPIVNTLLSAAVKMYDVYFLFQAKMLSWWHVCILWAFVLELGVRGSDFLAYKFAGTVGAGNFSYFKLRRDGVVKLVLDSTAGDADLYVSSTTLSPDYINYELCSATCGLDDVTVPSEMNRPIGVGIFGHPSHEISEYELSVWLDKNTMSSNGDKNHSNSENEEEESLFWSILLGVLKLILDLLM